MTLDLPDGYEHGTTRAYRHCRPACVACRAANTAAAAARPAAKLADGMPAETHGKPSGYTFWNCRCKRCKRAYRASNAVRTRATPPAPDLVAMPAEDHGTTRGYNRWRCKCGPCKAAGTRQRAERKEAKRAAYHGPVSIKRYRYRINPEPAVEEGLRRTLGSCRFVYNSYIALARSAHAVGAPHPDGYAAAKLLVTEARKAEATAWLTDVPSAVLRSAVSDAATAYENYFSSCRGARKGARIGAPKFRKRGHRQAARFPENAFSIRGGWQDTGPGGGRLRLSKIGDIRVNWHRPLPGYPSAATIIYEPDGTWWVSFIVRVPVDPPKTPTRQPRTAGIDLGTEDFAALVYDDGTREKVAAPKRYQKAEDSLRRADNNLSRKKPGSKNYEKARRARARAHRRVANLREDHARQLASKLTRENQAVCVETLNITGMVSSGHKKRNKSIHDAGWRQFLRFLEEACDRKGVTLVKAPRYLPSTQVCSICGVNSGPKPLEIRDWVCPGCGTHLDRDYNAAVNILVAGPATCGRDMSLRLAAAVPDEAESHRSEALVKASRRRKRVRRP
ncbi:transposase [Microbacterium sp. zg-Y818]|uniref:RNA-guided endonuclease InsQ/TnpB family protein n=1 Tax=unclassified Microbacterium TaxID=2609290 RepID=UPI00214BAB1A|nr:MULTISPECIES: transposase [unclassified Microbacterium]MCR2800216.1 transposase [Microbacterium sp. zg.Y818]WIM22183.1 transposase [Microbacterium sp. zg-Y818]